LTKGEKTRQRRTGEEDREEGIWFDGDTLNYGAMLQSSIENVKSLFGNLCVARDTSQMKINLISRDNVIK
jgi:hypothetical protein